MLVMLAAWFGTLGQAGDDVRQGPPFPRIANCYGVGLAPDSTDKDVEEVARFDLLIGGMWANWGDPESVSRLSEKIAAVRERNPRIIVLDFSCSAPYADPKDATFPAGGWLLTPDGTKVLGWPGTEMIGLGKPEVVRWLAARAVDSVRTKHLDGSFIDCMGSGFDWWACNIESGKPCEIDADGDGKPDDRAALDSKWVEAKTELAREVREGLGPEPVFMANQAGEWAFDRLNGILFEDDLDYILDRRASRDWPTLLAAYLHWTQTPHRPCVTTIVSSSGIEPPYDPWRTMTEEARNALLDRGKSLENRMRFGLATTLMGDGYFAYDLHTRWRGQRWWYPEYDAPLGYPTGPGAEQPDGTWRREFDGGAVIVNPTALDARVSFDGTRVDLSSDKVGREFVVPSHDGRIYLPTTDEPRPGGLADPDPLMTLEGPERVVERGNSVLVRLDRAAAVFDDAGRLLTLTDGKHALVSEMRPFVVVDDKWRDFAYEGCSHRVRDDGVVEFTGRRTDGGVALEFTQEVRGDGSALTVSYRWRAVTGAHFHMFRQQVDFPVAVYGGGSFNANGTRGMLPVERAPEPGLAGGLREITVTSPSARGIAAQTSGDAYLVDERHYGASAYRLGFHPVQGDVRAGAEWKYDVKLSVR